MHPQIIPFLNNVWDLPLIFSTPQNFLDTKKLLLCWNTPNATLTPEILLLSSLEIDAQYFSTHMIYVILSILL